MSVQASYGKKFAKTILELRAPSLRRCTHTIRRHVQRTFTQGYVALSMAAHHLATPTRLTETTEQDAETCFDQCVQHTGYAYDTASGSAEDSAATWSIQPTSATSSGTLASSERDNWDLLIVCSKCGMPQDVFPYDPTILLPPWKLLAAARIVATRNDMFAVLRPPFNIDTAPDAFYFLGELRSRSSIRRYEDHSEIHLNGYHSTHMAKSPKRSEQWSYSASSIPCADEGWSTGLLLDDNRCHRELLIRSHYAPVELILILGGNGQQETLHHIQADKSSSRIGMVWTLSGLKPSGFHKARRTVFDAVHSDLRALAFWTFATRPSSISSHFVQHPHSDGLLHSNNVHSRLLISHSGRLKAANTIPYTYALASRDSTSIMKRGRPTSRRDLRDDFG
ncbi:uncharacterized protein MYCFIDRAFT_180404 [Pseudocercospora fijiensis CIRAD86]|uniref:Uncharacterized protein n=1 Tax=Pseudocercospora fijiensis (strain CIRAD86) TaxID=383855 RepID=M2ZY76_PSEFD|nr:uncharacterized protein MYCFIDRAFT_180404 [Pseudocercospora fijiensis CIRAD86]EME77071.1 hypothetical protein MYCFIDRAFT_180404 [Pseudocercospora fijiensis CIRAD86]